jgi:hypothetical protein
MSSGETRLSRGFEATVVNVRLKQRVEDKSNPEVSRNMAIQAKSQGVNDSSSLL